MSTDAPMTKKNYGRAMTHHSVASQVPRQRVAGDAANRPVDPPNAAIIEADRAIAAAAKNPLPYSMGEPLPGRSVLDKRRAAEAVAAAAAERAAADNDDPPIVLDKRVAQRAAQLAAERGEIIVLRTASEIESTRRAAKGYPPLRRTGSRGE